MLNTAIKAARRAGAIINRASLDLEKLQVARKGPRDYVTEDGDVDHIIPLANGGEHRERNLQVLCSWCHGAKTKEDVKKKSKSYRVRQKHYGIKKPRVITRWRTFSGAIVERPRER